MIDANLPTCILVLRGVTLEVGDGEIVSLLGANGAGKSTTLKSISGLLHSQEGEVTRGGIEWDGQPIHNMDPDEIVRMGIVQVLEGRPLFEHLTVEENLRTGWDWPRYLCRPSSRSFVRSMKRLACRSCWLSRTPTSH